MSYQKTTWVDGTTPSISAQNLNHIESGIESVDVATSELALSVSQLSASTLPYSSEQSTKQKIDEVEEKLSGPTKLLDVAGVSTEQTDYYLSETMQNYRFLLFAGAWNGGIDTMWMLVPIGTHTEPFNIYLNNIDTNSYYVVDGTNDTTKITAHSSNNKVTMRVYGIK